MSLRVLNLGILAHVDAGKTSLTERLLFDAGVLDQLGGVDAGTTTTDTMALERARGITIRAAATSFVAHDTVINVIDTPGHPDFLAEVERSLVALDAAVLVVSAVEGVQAQTVVLFRALRRLGLPIAIFINKIDRMGADPDRVLHDLTARLSPEMWDLRASAQTDPQLADSLRTEICCGRTYPVWAGSALTGAGVADLVTGLCTYFAHLEDGAVGGTSAQVFKVEKEPGRQRRAFVRIRTGALQVRMRYGDQRITELRVFDVGGSPRVQQLPAGRIGVVTGLRLRPGDWIGEPNSQLPQQQRLTQPTLITMIRPDEPRQAAAMYSALSDLTEVDPLIDLRRDAGNGEIVLSLCGEVQREIIGALLADDYGIAVHFGALSVACIERIIGVGAGLETIGEGDNPFLATVGLRVQPGPVGSGLDYGLEVELGAMPPAFHRVLEATVCEALGHGALGWPVPDVLVRVTHTGYWPRQSHAHATFDKAMSTVGADFRGLVPLVLASALAEAGTLVCEPIESFELELADHQLGAAVNRLGALGGAVRGTALHAGRAVLIGEIPTSAITAWRRQLSGLASGEAALLHRFDHYAPVRGPAPKRRSSGPNPFHRNDYLRRVGR